MRQGWLQLAGLVFDISGFMLIVTEWWNAVIRERATELVHTAQRYEEVASQIAKLSPKGAIGRRALDYLLLALLQEKDRKLNHAQYLADHDPVLVFRKRLRNFLAGAALVILGFVLQALSAIPGGIPKIGIVP